MSDGAETIQKLRTEIDKIKHSRNQENGILEQFNGAKDNVSFKTTKSLVGHFGKIYAMHWAQDSKHLASASQDGKLMIWDGHTTNKRHMINLRSSWVMTCAYSPSGKLVACGGLDNLCSIYGLDFSTAETHDRPNAELSRHDGYLSCCRFLDDGHILTASGDGTIIHWDIENNTPIKIYGNHEADVMSISLNPFEESLFISGSCDQTAKSWDLREPSETHTFIGHSSDINSVQWFPAGNSFGSGSDDATIRLFDLRYYGQLAMYNDDNMCGVTYIDFSKTGKYLFAGYDDVPYAKAWSVLTGAKISDLATQARVSCLGVPKSGYCACTGSWDNNLQIWTAVR